MVKLLSNIVQLNIASLFLNLKTKMNFNFKKLALATLTIQEYKISAFSYHFKVVTFPYYNTQPSSPIFIFGKIIGKIVLLFRNMPI